MAHEWDLKNFKKFINLIFGASLDDNFLKKSLSYLHDLSIATAAYTILSLRERGISSGSRRAVSFSGNFIEDLRKYCNAHYIFFEDLEVEKLFSDINYSISSNENSPYKNMHAAKKCCQNVIKRPDESGSGTRHRAMSITWSQLYNFHVSGIPSRNSDLIKLYVSFFKSKYGYNDGHAIRMASTLIKKCIIKLSQIGASQSRGSSSVGKNSGEFQRQGIRLLANIHGSRSDLAGGEKVSIGKIMSSFCLQPNLFQINERKVLEVLSEDMSNFATFEPEKEMLAITKDEVTLKKALIGVSIRKDASPKEISLMVMIKEGDKDVSLDNLGITEKDKDDFLKCSFGLYQGNSSGWVESEITPDMFYEEAKLYYEEETVKNIVEEFPDEYDLWGITAEELAKKVLLKIFPLDSFIHTNFQIISLAKNYLKTNLTQKMEIKDNQFILID